MKKEDTKKEDTFAIVWVIICMAWLILGLVYSIKGMEIQSTKCTIHAIIFYLFFMTEVIIGRLRDIDHRLRKLEEGKADDES